MGQIGVRAEPQRALGRNPFGIGLENPRDGTGIPDSDILTYPPTIMEW
jgi:hypothetical protein